VASAKGRVEVLVPPRDSYSEVKPKARAVIVGESIGPGATLITGSGASVNLLLTNGTLAHLGENTKLVLTALYQKGFKGSDQKANELTKEVSPSRTALKLEEGDLVLEVRKLSKESSFLISTKMAQAGIRGTQFKVSANADSAELSVLEGRVDFLDAEQLATPVETGKKAGTRKGMPAKLEDMSAIEQAEVKQAVEQAKGASASIDLNRLANTIEGYSPKPNYIVKSALNMELIWCPPGSFIMGPDGNGLPAHPVILTKGFYLGKYEVTQEEYEKVMGNNPSNFKGNKLPVETVLRNDVEVFCNTMSRKERKRGWVFTLPTEAQWEYACRAGTTTRFSWGNQGSSQFANCLESGVDKTMNVGSYASNPWGFYDMHGNVWEICLDWNEPSPAELKVDPVGKTDGKYAMRGGAFTRSIGQSDSVSRLIRSNDNNGLSTIGFRVALIQVD